MTRVHDRTTGASVRGVLRNGEVTSLSVKRHGAAAAMGTYRVSSGRLENEFVSLDGEPTTEIDSTSRRDGFHDGTTPDSKADYLLANSPFSGTDWRGELLKCDKCWAYGVPRAGSANYACVRDSMHRMAHIGLAGFMLDLGAVSSGPASTA